MMKRRSFDPAEGCRTGMHEDARRADGAYFLQEKIRLPGKKSIQTAKKNEKNTSEA
jgi:hypothetical protein